MYELTRELKVGNIEGVRSMPGDVYGDPETGFAINYDRDSFDFDRLVFITFTRATDRDLVTVASEDEKLIDGAYMDFLRTTGTVDPGYRS